MLQNILNLDGVTVLNKKQQKIISGGLMSTTGTCAAQVTNANGDMIVITDVDITTAQIAAGYGASLGLDNNWCCDSCGSASWMQ